jgi:hypothetical protein
MSKEIKEEVWLGWHFIQNNGCLSGYIDDKGRKKPHSGKKAVVGKTIKVRGKLSLCNHGLHASKRVLDALEYAPGAVVCRVQLSGKIIEGDDKACASERTVVAVADIGDILHEFACWCAEQSLNNVISWVGSSPDPFFEAVNIKRKWLKGEATDEELVAAENAARSAARSAAQIAARSAQNEKLESMVKEFMGVE